MFRVHVSTFMAAVIVVTDFASACERNTPTAPSASALVTFAVANEISRVSFAL
jgi:hypothetical protein